MYRKGDAGLITEAPEWYLQVHRSEYTISDCRSDDGCGRYVECKPPMVILPHSCEAWVIGGYNEVHQMMRDLQAILDNWPKNKVAEDGCKHGIPWNQHCEGCP